MPARLLQTIGKMTPALAVDVREPAPATPGVPQRIGRFIVREEIGRGSNGVVYAATDPVLGRDVAIKAIPLKVQPVQLEGDAGFLQEAKIAAALNHASIVTVFDAGKTDTFAYIAMERLNGSDLHHWLQNNRPMSAESAAALMARVADAVHYAHRRGLIHRDIKPSNIFLGRDMKPKVLDFGIALALGNKAQGSETRKLIGTPNYMSPEQALGRPLDARSDVFSIGTILYELITGERAFDGEKVEDILSKVVKSEPAALSNWRQDISPLMREIIARALAKNPAQRYQSAGQLRNDLAAFAGRPVPPGTTPPGDLGITPMSRNRLQLPGRGILVGTALAVVGLSLAFGLWFANVRSENEEATALAAAQALAQEQAQAAEAAAAAAAKTAAERARSERLASQAAAAAAARAAAEAAAAAAAKAAEAHATTVRHAQAPPAPPPEPGRLALAVTPWGEVFVDGASVGVSPPLSQLSLPAGTHTVEVRNGSTPAYSVKLEVEPGKTVRLEHRF
jgi:eukaryotic-like serine/threonine-protein kinase